MDKPYPLFSKIFYKVQISYKGTKIVLGKIFTLKVGDKAPLIQ